ncbi:hypothetical protein ALC62_00807 [Cyphomyrmex costatus]|uniref:Uncharacterized protein n=1 Tax=Cyphomyrmex costatus TaxID=456900 RepID=A0A151IQ86_9HYME|nr:hypothetical protein ALC62_00807 [Cyphomyrmex costatus]
MIVQDDPPAPAGDRQVSADVLTLTAHMLGPPSHFSSSENGTGLLPVCYLWPDNTPLPFFSYHNGIQGISLLLNARRDSHYSHFRPIACHIETIPNKR